MSVPPATVAAVPVWGAAYVERWLEQVLPSWLAQGNLPALAAGGSLTLQVLTTRADSRLIEAHALADRLRGVADLSLVEIDDLVPGGVPSVTLTLAFARAAAFSTRDGARPRLVFLNADFFLTDGSLASVARAFDAGARLLLCSSLRVTEHRGFERLALEARQPDGTITLGSRAAMACALGAVHHTATACRVDQPLVSSVHPNQFFWRGDAGTLLARSFLMFPLAVLPQRAAGPATGYCDYGWIGTLAPEAPISVLSDSDDFLAVELSSPTQELDFVRAGPADAAATVQSLSVWMTPFSLPQPDTPLLFRAADPTPALDAVVQASQAHVDRLRADVRPVGDAENHPYWVSGVRAWLERRSEAGVTTVPPELRVPDPATETRDPALRRGVRLFGRGLLMGRPGGHHLWHPLWWAERQLPVGRLVTSGGRWHGMLTPPDGPGICALAEADRPGGLEAAVDALAEHVRSGEAAFLIVVPSTALATRILEAPQRLAVLAAVDRSFAVEAVVPLATPRDLAAVASYWRIGTELHMAGRGRRVALAASVLAHLWATLGRNLLRRLGLRPQPEAAGLCLLRLRAR